MPKQSAGILLYRFEDEILEVLLVHPGGPFWKNKDLAAWSIPKGEFEPGEDPKRTAIREFREELGRELTGELLELRPIRQAGGKIVHAYAVEGDLDTDNIESNTFEREWPPRSGKFQTYPEVDRAEWFNVVAARSKIIPAQSDLIDQLGALLGLPPFPK